ncbi:MAG: Thiol-disulfide oxidoreductase ResA [Planctomycetota bacterium]
MRSATALLLALLAALAPTVPAHAAPPAIPDDWFFDGANRPAPLKQLEGKPAPELELESWIGDSVDLKGQRGKVVVVDFWATWCGPCMAAIPENVELMSKHKDDGLVFIGVHDSNSGFDRAAQVVKDKKINYPVAKDKGGKSTKNFNLQFWPTYVVIDREGIVRAAGLIPSNVSKVVEMLLKESAPTTASGNGGGLAADYFTGGAKRPVSLRAAEGKQLPALKAQAWVGTAPTPERLKGSVLVIHFTSGDGAIAKQQLQAIAALEKELTPQGVVFVAICEANAALKPTQDALASLKSDIAIGHDLPAEQQESDGKKPKAQGQTAKSLGVRFFPTTFVIDRNGVVRAAGVKIDRTKELVEKLLAEEVKP